MARFGEWKPLASNWASRPRMTQVDIISVHTMVGSLAGTDGMWRKTGYAGNHSHFGVGGNGACWQWQDTAYQGAANYNGNWHIISVECADVGPEFAPWNYNDGNAIPAFTDAQIETLARLVAAMCQAHNIPCALIPDAKPGRRGIGYHRLGVPGFMVAGAEQWSTVNRKVCPGDRRIAQIPQVIARANQILEGDDMDISELYAARDSQNRNWLDFQNFVTGVFGELNATLAATRAEVAELRKAIGATSGGPVDVKAVAEALTVVPKN